ncbi:hypothetical protein WDW86_22510 [Bdellovibrionota bacterium FG-2]
MLTQKAETIERENSENGWAYVISGAVGYGSYLVLINNDYLRFERILKGVPSLSKVDRERLSRQFLEQNSERARGVRKIRVISHSLTAALNILNAATSSQPDLSTALYFVGGVNVLAAASCIFSKSEEEILPEPTKRVELMVGLMVRLRISF